MQITPRKNGAVMILDLTGKLVIGNGDSQLREAVRSSLDDGMTKIVLNMAGTTTIDSSGVGELVSSYTTTSGRGGKLALLNVPPKITDILTITQLITVFATYDTEAEAVSDLS